MHSSLALTAQLGVSVGDLRDCSEQLEDGAFFFFWFLDLPQIFFWMALGSCLIFLVIGKTSLSYKSQEKELFAECKAIVFCDYKYTTSC